MSWNGAGLDGTAITGGEGRILLRFEDRRDQTEGPDDGGQSSTTFGLFVLPRSTKPRAVEANVQDLIRAPPKWKERARFEAVLRPS